MGLACEASGDSITAVACFKAALQMLSAQDPSTAQRHPAATARGTPLRTAVQLNLARALCGAGRYEEACNLYGELEFSAELDGHPHAFISYALAQLHSGNSSGARYSIQSALHGADGDTAAQAVRTLLQVEWQGGQPGQAVAALQQHLPVLGQLKAPAEAVQRLWVAAVAGAAVTGDGEVVRLAVLAAKLWACDADAEDPAFHSELLSLLGLHALASQRPRDARCFHARAVHLCPWSPAALVSCAGVAMQASPGYAAVAQRLLASPAVVSAAVATAGDEAALAPFGEPLAQSALEAGTAALVARCVSAVGHAAAQQVSAGAAQIHRNPFSARAWYLTALCSMQLAAASGLHSRYASAQRWCRTATAVLGKQEGDGQRAMRAQLALCSSECLLRSGTSPSTAALAAAEQAAQLAAGNNALQAAAGRQYGRCLWAAGDVTGAEAALRQAAAQSPANPATATDLAALLSQYGRGEEAVEVLQAASAAGALPPGSLAGNSSQQQLLLQLARLLAVQDLDAAKAAAAEADSLGASLGPAAASTMGASKVLLGALFLQEVQGLPADSEGMAALLREARRPLSAAVGHGEAGIACALLAQVERLGSMRKKEDKIEGHATQVCVPLLLRCDIQPGHQTDPPF